MPTNTTNSTHCSAPVPVSDPFLLAVDRASPASFVIASTEETYKPTFRITTDGIRTLPYQPFFNAYLSQDQPNQTGAGTWGILIADSIISNIGEHYNATSGQFTAPVSGVYHFDANIVAYGITNAMTSSLIRIVMGSREIRSDFSNPAARKNSEGQAAFSSSWSGFMEANQTASTHLYIRYASQNTAGFKGDTGQIINAQGRLYTSSGFSGYLIG